jgi:hypothetical protein
MAQSSLGQNLQIYVENMESSWGTHTTITHKEMVWLSQKKTLIQILKKTIESNHESWNKKLIDALWEIHITPKDSTGHSPYTRIVYGRESILPLHLELNSLALIGSVEDVEETITNAKNIS